VSLDPARAACRLGVRRALHVRGDGQGGHWVPEVDVVLVACSGGADSLALLAATVFELRRAPTRVVGVVVDHGLQDDSAAHTARVVDQMAGLGVDETVGARVAVDPGGRGVEAAAREARYAVLEQVAATFRAQVVLLGHTLDDQAETVLLGLARGSGGRSIAGMRPAWGHDPRFTRPLLDVRRAQTEAACTADGITWWDDPHNADPRFTRSRVRHSVLPLLERELGPGVAETLARTAEQLRPDMEHLDGLAAAELRSVRAQDGALDRGLLETRDEAVVSRVVRLAALEAGSPASELAHVHVVALTGLVWGPAGREVQLPGHLTAYVDGEWLRFRRT